MSTDKAPSLSVVLTAYNRAHVLERTLDAILGQTYDAFELIVSDDCSTDETARIVEAYAARDKRVRYRRNRVNLNMPGNLNAAIREARGEFVANLHDGDLFDPTLLEKWLAALRGCENAAFVFNAYRVLGPDGSERRIDRVELPRCMPGSLLLERSYFRRWRFNSPVWGTVMARRRAYEAVGPFRDRFGMSSDVDMWMRSRSATTSRTWTSR